MTPETKVPLLKDFLSYLRKPFYRETPERLPISSKLLDVSILLSWSYLLAMPLSILVNLVVYLVQYKGVNAVTGVVQEFPLFYVVLLGGVIAPLTEETLFRLALRFKPVYLYFMVSILLYTIFNYINFGRATGFGHIFIVNVIAPFIVALPVLFIARIKNVRTALQNVYARFFPAIIYAFTITFGLMHISNFPDRENIWFVLPILVLPQIMIGLVLAYIRTRYGFWYNVILHSAYNSLVLIPSSLVTQSKEPVYMLMAAPFCGIILFLLMYGLIWACVDGVRWYRINHPVALQPEPGA